MSTEKHAFKACVYSAVASFFLSARGVSSQNLLFADGGFYTEPIECYNSSWVYKAENKSEYTVTGCVSIIDYPPFTTRAIDPIDPRTDNTRWCPTEDKYNPVNTDRQKVWGYCLDKSIEYPLSVLDKDLYADGGFQKLPQKCISGEWTYRERLTSGETNDTTITGCASIEEHKPYPFYDPSSQSSGDVLVEPVSNHTDKSKWCAITRDVYNPTAAATSTNRLLWGYCLDNTGSVIVTDAPTVPSDTTVSPTIGEEETVTPTTSGEETVSPTTSSEVTVSPTASVTLAPVSEQFTITPTIELTFVPTSMNDSEYENDNETDGGRGAAGHVVVSQMLMAGVSLTYLVSSLL